MDNKQLNNVVFITNIASIVVVVSCVIAILFLGCNLISSEEQSQNHEVKVIYKMEIDSTFTKESLQKSLFQFKENAEKNNEKIYGEINELITHFEEDNRELLRQKQEQSNFVSLSSAILGILLAIAGFFGFKSIKEMKKDSLDTAAETAEKTAEKVAVVTAKETAKNTAEEVAKTEMREKYFNIKDDVLETLLAEVKVQIDKKQFSNIDDLKSQVEELKSMINECCEKDEQEEKAPGDPETEKPELVAVETKQDQDQQSLFSDDDLEQ
ncbi:hypothetical protein [Mangrovimonas sp. ST2L15]|uniref:hypothetical protein n=1 Tax=Mangrovimonas sp. ST2L15 TaxID=1645916 RepID=UPI0006B43343|nr:hypothetical protein [Mangrovimonas sp. ST2L15]